MKAKQMACKVKVSEAFTVLQLGTKILPFVVFLGKQTEKLKHLSNMQKNKDRYPQMEIYCTMNP